MRIDALTTTAADSTAAVPASDVSSADEPPKPKQAIAIQTAVLTEYVRRRGRHTAADSFGVRTTRWGRVQVVVRVTVLVVVRRAVGPVTGSMAGLPLLVPTSMAPILIESA